MRSREFILDGHPFGGEHPVGLIAWETPSITDKTGDAERAGHGLIAGRDRKRGTLWRFKLTTPYTHTEMDARDALVALAAVWAASADLPPGGLQTLRYKTADRWRRVYGRARAWAPEEGSPLVSRGRIDVEADFQVMEPWVYDDDEETLTFVVAPGVSQGLVFPSAPPFNWSKEGSPQAKFATVDGDAPAPVVVTFEGPVLDPWVEIGGARVALTGTVPAGRAVTVDSRSFETVWSKGASGSAGGMLAPRTRLADARLSPGRQTVNVGGVDVTGTAKVSVSWRPTWRSV